MHCGTHTQSIPTLSLPPLSLPSPNFLFLLIPIPHHRADVLLPTSFLSMARGGRDVVGRRQGVRRE